MCDFRLISNRELNGIASNGNKFGKLEHAESVARSRKGQEVIVENNGTYSLYDPMGKDAVAVSKLAKNSNLKIIELVDTNNNIINIASSDKILGVGEKVSDKELKGIASNGNGFKNFTDAESVAKKLTKNVAIVNKDSIFYLYNINDKNINDLMIGTKQKIDSRIVSVVKNTSIASKIPSLGIGLDEKVAKYIPNKTTSVNNKDFNSDVKVNNSKIAYTSNGKIMLDNKEFKISGINVYDLADVAARSQSELEKTLKTLSDSGANTVRFWAFSSNSPDTFKRIFETSKNMGLDLKFIPVLGNQWKDMEAPQSSFTKKDNWYDQGYKKDYLPHVLETVKSFVNQDNILMIELMNEPEAGHNSLKRFADTVSTDIRDVYKQYEQQTGTKVQHHLISLGTLGGEGRNGMVGSDFKDLYSLPNIDVVTAHDYTFDDHQSKENNISPLFQQYIDYAKQLNKPFFLGEIGIKVRKDGVENAGIPLRSSDQAMKIMENKMKIYNEKGISGALLWGPQPAGHAVDGAGYGFTYNEGDKIQSTLKEIFSKINP